MVIRLASIDSPESNKFQTKRLRLASIHRFGKQTILQIEPGKDIFHCSEPLLPFQISRRWYCNRSQLVERTKPIRAATALAICANSAAHSLWPTASSHNTRHHCITSQLSLDIISLGFPYEKMRVFRARVCIVAV